MTLLEAIRDAKKKGRITSDFILAATTYANRKKFPTPQAKADTLEEFRWLLIRDWKKIDPSRGPVVFLNTVLRKATITVYRRYDSFQRRHVPLCEYCEDAAGGAPARGFLSTCR